MRGYSRTIVAGNTGADPETRQVGETSVTKVSIATTEAWTDKSGQKQERTTWHRCELWGKMGQVVQQYVKKGDALLIEGKRKTDKYTDKDGVERYSETLVADNMELLGGRQDGQQSTPAPAPASPDAGGGFDDSAPF